MFIKATVAALIGYSQAGVVPLIKRDLTMRDYDNAIQGIENKFLGGQQEVGINVPIADFTRAQYFIEVEIGSPGQKFTMVPDTGTSNLWVYSSKCWSIPCWTHKKFNNHASSTYHKDGQAFVTQYKSGGVSGTTGKDVASIGGIKATMKFGEITQATGNDFIGSKMDGIMGLAYNTDSVDGLKTWLD